MSLTIPKLNLIGLDLTRSFQLGGNLGISKEKKQELFPYFAYLYSQQLDPDKYGAVASMEEWSNLIQGNEEDINKITEVASKLSDDDWKSIDKQYAEAQSGQDISESDQVAYAAKGAKLKKLIATKGKEGMVAKKKVMPKSKKKKCGCGCDMILSKSAGGKVIETCSCKCGGKIKKKK